MMQMVVLIRACNMELTSVAMAVATCFVLLAISECAAACTVGMINMCFSRYIHDTVIACGTGTD